MADRAVEPRSDDGEEFYAMVVYGESVQAWRLVDGRWLTRRQLNPFGDDAELVDSIAVVAQMPR